MVVVDQGPDIEGVLIGEETTIQASLLLLDQVDTTTKAMVMNARMDVPGMDNAELRPNAQVIPLVAYLIGYS